MNDFNDNSGEYNYHEMNDIKEEDHSYYENIEESDGNNNINNKDNFDSMNKNIILGADKLNLIFNSQKNYKFTSEEDNENENYVYDGVFSDSNQNINYSENENNNIDLDKKKNLTYKNKYEKIGTIFDKLEEIFDKKKEQNNILDINNDKFKTPVLNKDTGHIRSRISDFNLQEEDYFYNYNEKKENDSSKKRKNTYNKIINMDKYQKLIVILI